MEINKLFGNLVVLESDVLKRTNSTLETSLRNATDSPMFGTLRIKLKKFSEHVNGDYQMSLMSSKCEFSTLVQPNYLASLKNLLFVLDELGNLTINELTAANEFKIRANLKLNLVNVKSLALSQCFMAITLTDLNKEQMKSIYKKYKLKNMEHKCGIMLFKMDSSLTNPKFDRLIDLNKYGGFKSPSGIGLLDPSLLFVCDRETRCVLKIDIKSGDLVQHIQLNEADPTGICLLERKYLIVADSFRHELSLYDADKLIKLRATKLSDEFQSFNGPYDITVLQRSSQQQQQQQQQQQDDYLLFVKNRADTKVLIYDMSFNLYNYFEYEHSNLQGIASIANMKSNRNDLLILGVNYPSNNVAAAVNNGSNGKSSKSSPPPPTRLVLFSEIH
mgnify:CR=1 FL=1